MFAKITDNDRGIYEGVFHEGSGSNESFSFVNAGVQRSVRRALDKRAVKKLSRLGRPAKCRTKERFEARKPVCPFALLPANILLDVSGICVVCQPQMLDLRTKLDWHIIANTLLCAGLLQKFN